MNSRHVVRVTGVFPHPNCLLFVSEGGTEARPVLAAPPGTGPPSVPGSPAGLGSKSAVLWLWAAQPHLGAADLLQRQARTAGTAASFPRSADAAAGLLAGVTLTDSQSTGGEVPDWKVLCQLSWEGSFFVLFLIHISYNFLSYVYIVSTQSALYFVKIIPK